MHIEKITYRYLPHFRKNFEMPKKNHPRYTLYINPLTYKILL